MTKSERARLMKAEHPEMNACAIARAIGMDRSHAYDALARPGGRRPPKPKPPWKPRMPIDGTRFSLQLPNHHADAVTAEAVRSKRQRADVIREAVREWYLRRQQKEQAA